MSNCFSKGYRFLSRVFLTAMVLLMGVSYGYAQKSEVSGTVTDQQGAPVIGVTILVYRGGEMLNGTTTDANGFYTISVSKDAETIKFSFIGMKDVVETINGRTRIDVRIIDSTTVLNEVVVTALGIKKEQKSLSYNVQSVTPEGFDPSGSFVNSLSGKIAGVTINSSSVGVGGSSRVVMRGTKSLTGNNNALYVIDGIPMPNLSSEQPSGVYEGAGQSGDGLGSINPDDIESISVLSGPSAAALYGS